MNATQAIVDWIAAHPYQTAFHIVNGVIICTPAAATVPFLSAMGFSATGPVAGKSYTTSTAKYAHVAHVKARPRLLSCRTSPLCLLEAFMRQLRAQLWAATERALLQVPRRLERR